MNKYRDLADKVMREYGIGYACTPGEAQGNQAFLEGRKSLAREILEIPQDEFLSNPTARP